ncbi:MAG: DUF2017 family protein [Actinomycetota bacterium]
MSRTFRRSGDAIRVTFATGELELLRSLRDQIHDALSHPDPDDPVYKRLFPPAVLGDPDAERELRELLVDDLLASRRAGLDALVALFDRATPHRNGVRIDLVDDEPLLVLGVLNDVRLAIGARIDIDALDRDAVAYRLALMDHLGWWQEQLLVLLDPAAGSSHPPDVTGSPG